MIMKNFSDKTSEKVNLKISDLELYNIKFNQNPNIKNGKYE